MIAWIAIAWQGIVGVLLIFCGLYCFRLSRRLRTPNARPSTPPAVDPVDAIADMLETKAEIRKDEVRRWAEAWQRAAGLPDFWETVREIREVEYRAVRDDRERQRVAAEQRRVLEIEERQAERTARLEAERRQAEEECAAIARHQAHLAERRRRYAEAKRRRTA